MEIKIYQVDAFAEKVFSGNPAAVCPLDKWLPDETMQNIAMENCLAETAFYVHEKDGLRIRWFTPTVEVDLCGHATLATAFVLFNHENYQGNKIVFNSRSGPLTVTKSNDLLTLNFPVDTLTEVSPIPELEEGLGIKSIKTFKGKTDYLLVFESEDEIKNMNPDFKMIGKVEARGVIVTAKGKQVDFVSRFFGPQSGGDEDPVTGSAHTSLTPHWAKVLNKTEFTALQLSSRQGKLKCKLLGDRVEISGQARLYLIGRIFLQPVDKIEIINYQRAHQPWFEKLNRDWIEKYFWMEPIDVEVLHHPEEHILKKGGTIFIGTYNHEIAGTAAVKFVEQGVYEFTKMAVDEKFQGKKIGKAIAQAAIQWSKNAGARRIILYSNTKLETAIAMYRKLGFVEIPLDGPYKRSDIKMELKLED